MPAYLAFGLRIDSERALPDGVLLDSKARAEPSDRCDVAIRWQPSTDTRPGAAEGEQGWFEFQPELHRFGWPDLGVVEILGGREVSVLPHREVAAGLVEHVLLGPVMADILLTRGFVPLHASAVSVGEAAVAFVGRSGQGKSTLAAAMHRAGYPVHADDLLACSPEGSPVPFGIARVKLNPDSATQLGEDPAQLGSVYEGIEKRTKVVISSSQRTSRKLKAIYRITDADTLSVEPVEPRRAMFEIFANCFRVEVEQHACGAQELLRRCGALSLHTPVFALKRPRDFARLPEVVAAVAEHARRL